MNASTIKPGDRVRINAPREPMHRKVGRVTELFRSGVFTIAVKLPGEPADMAFGLSELELLDPAPRMSLPARTLLAAWHASDRTLAKLTDNVCGLHRIRRYGVTADDGLAADLTLTTEVQL